MRVLSVLRRRLFSEIILERVPDVKDLIYEKNGVRFTVEDIAELERIPIALLHEYVGETCLLCNGIVAWRLVLKDRSFAFLCRFCGDRLSEKLSAGEGFEAEQS